MLFNEDNGILPVKAVTAVPLTAEQTKKLCDKLQKNTGKTIELINVVDPACIGGVRLDYDGKRMDDTVQHRLDVYHASTEILKDYYAKQGKLRLISGDQTIQSIFGDILKAIGEEL